MISREVAAAILGRANLAVYFAASGDQIQAADSWTKLCDLVCTQVNVNYGEGGNLISVEVFG